MLLQLHHTAYTDACLPITDGRAGQETALPSSSYALSCLLYLLTDSAIALAGTAADSYPIMSRRTPTGDAAEPSSLFTSGTVKKNDFKFSSLLASDENILATKFPNLQYTTPVNCRCA